MTSRHEIDGLRAIAVMGVILYHLGLKFISVGYAGVDVFFVISGFLIGGIIFRQRQNGTFSYRDFYARRARRILPALFTVILFSMLAGWLTMMPNTLRPLTIIGLISYSAYLWHQPIISFLDISGYPVSGPRQIITTLIVILTASALSWRFIEQPFCNGSNLPKRVARASLITAGLGIAAFSIGGHVTKGYPDRMPPEAHQILSYENSQSKIYMQCIAVRKTVDGLEMGDPAPTGPTRSQALPLGLRFSCRRQWVSSGLCDLEQLAAMPHPIGDPFPAGFA